MSANRRNDKLPLATPEWEWREAALCRGMNPEEFFPGRGQPIPHRIIELCDQCPAQDCCYKYGRTNKLTGVWGGTNRINRRYNYL